MLVKEANSKPIKCFLPLKVANFIASILEKQALKTGKEPLMTTFSYEETIRDEVRWLKKEGKIK